jgi:hypothetical protein
MFICRAPQTDATQFVQDLDDVSSILSRFQFFWQLSPGTAKNPSVIKRGVALESPTGIVLRIFQPGLQRVEIPYISNDPMTIP